MARKNGTGDLRGALIDCRATLELSLREVGEAVGLSQAAVSNIERGLAQPRRTTRIRLLAFLRQRGYTVEEVA
jgi:transcriptional regulator with XRE-family HTH domain